MSFPKYPDYKPSRLDTRAPLPSSWSEAPIKRAFDIVSGSTPKTDNEEFWDGETTWVTPADLSGLDAVDVTESKRTITEAGLLSCGTTLVPAGSIVISTRAPIGTLAIAGKELCTNQGCKALVPNGECSSRFAYYYLSACTEQLNIKGRGTTFLELSGDELGSFLMPKPAPVEQELICAFLDRETAKIDALIAEQQRLIELLQEKRQAVISHAVAKGLNPNASMKDSGVEWLGEVPEHWEILPIWILFQLGRGRVISHEDIAQNPGDYPVYSSQTEDNGEMGRIGTFDFEGEYLTWTTDGANAGSVFRREGRFNCTNVCGTLKAKSSTHINLDFALASLRLATRAFVRMDINPKLMNNVMASIRVPVPPMGEQVEIIRKLDKQIRGFRPLEDSIEVQVCLLKERRSALISAAVTGQIDVRELVEAGGSEQ